MVKETQEDGGGGQAEGLLLASGDYKIAFVLHHGGAMELQKKVNSLLLSLLCETAFLSV